MQRVSVQGLIRQTWPGVAGVALLTALFRLVGLGWVAVAFLYILVVLFQALRSGAVSSLIVSICAVISLDYFFIPPVQHLQIGDPIDLVAFLTYALTALVVTYLATNVRKAELRARRHEKELQLLFSAASRLFAVEPDVAATQSLRVFREVFALRAVGLFLAEGKSREEGESVCNLSAQTRDAFLCGRDIDDPAHGLSVRRMQASGKTTGTIGLEGPALSPWVAGAISVLAAATCERASHLQEAIQSVSEARAEALRSAILDAFAHEFKTPLTAIMAAAGSLGEVGPLTPRQLEMADAIEERSAWLGKLTTRLLRAARLDREEVRPQLEQTELGSLVSRVVSSRATRSEIERLHVAPTGGHLMVLADPELLILGLVPVLDNALRYSDPDAPINVSLGSEPGWATIRVVARRAAGQRAGGLRLFERARDGVTQRAGSGLYISQKILRAHGGDIVLEDDGETAGKMTFGVRLPLPNMGGDYARRAS